MNPIQLLVGLAVGAFLVTLVLGLLTGRISWRQQGCCPADPDRDARMRTADPPAQARTTQPVV